MNTMGGHKSLDKALGKREILATEGVYKHLQWTSNEK